MADIAYSVKRGFSLGNMRKHTSKARRSQETPNLRENIPTTGKIRVIRLKSKQKEEHQPYAKLPSLSTSLPSSPQGKYLHKIDSFLTSLPIPQPLFPANYHQSRRLISEEVASIRKSLITSKSRAFSKTRIKLLDEEVVLSKAKIRMMLMDLKVKLRQARAIGGGA